MLGANLGLRGNPVTSAAGIGNLVTGSVVTGLTKNPSRRGTHLTCPGCGHRVYVQPEALEVTCNECGAKSRVNR